MRIKDKMPALKGATTWLNREITDDELMNEKLTLIYFWSISCGLCQRAMPKINTFHKDFKDQLNMIAVHMPRSEKDLDIKQVKAIAEKHNLTQPIFVDNEHKLTDAFDNRYVPAYYVFDTKGNLQHFQAGENGMNMLMKRVNHLLDI